MNGAEMIAAERQRQMDVEGWTAEHDAEHAAGDLTLAATAYLTQSDDWWPWDLEWWKPSDDPIRNLVKAGALIAAEIDRLQAI